MKYSKLIALLMVVLDLGAWLTLVGVLDPSGGMNVEELTAKAETYLAQGVYYDASQLYGQAVEADARKHVVCSSFHRGVERSLVELLGLGTIP